MIDEDLRDAALHAVGGRDSDTPPARIERAVLDVTVDGRTEMVTVAVRDGVLVATCTDGVDDGPHVKAALRALARQVPTGAAGKKVPSGLRTTAAGEVVAALRTTSSGETIAPAAAPSKQSSRDPCLALADAVEDIVTAVVRVGVRKSREAPTVTEAIERLVAAAPSPIPLGLSRWLGLLRLALAHTDLDSLARVLEGACRIADDLRDEDPDDLARRRIVSWLGANSTPGSLTRVSDLTLVELCREYVEGAQRRKAIERRYLVSVSTGEVFREERPVGGVGVSVGPCPRVVHVGLGEVEEGPEPKRIRLLQYAVSNTLASLVWDRLSVVSIGRWQDVAERYRQAIRQYPALAEPFALLRPKSLARDPHRLLDVNGLPLPVSTGRHGARAEALSEFVSRGELLWVAGRLIDAEGHLLMVPSSVGALIDGQRRTLRLG